VKRKYVLIPSSALAALVVALALLPDRAVPDPEAQSPEERAAYAASKSFARLSVDARRAYLQAAGMGRGGARPEPGTLSEAERTQLRKNVGEVRREDMQQRVQAYFALPPAQRTAYLDEMINQRLQREATRDRDDDRGGPGPGPERGGEGRGPTPERMKKRIENTPPEERAQMTEFRKAMRERMQARGIEGGMGPPGGR
jgi:hypothetical protein